jgi:hypothetical protein
MSRQYADYEYKVDGHTVRVERYADGWRWFILWADGGYAVQTDAGDYCRLKRDAKEQGIARAKGGDR